MKRFPCFILMIPMLAMPLAAQAYCCWNEAICKAVCGSRCCESGSFVSASGNSALGNIGRADITRELQAARDCDSRIRHALQRQVQGAGVSPERYRR